MILQCIWLCTHIAWRLLESDRIATDIFCSTDYHAMKVRYVVDHILVRAAKVELVRRLVPHNYAVSPLAQVEK
jgi:hypothetical protein